ncbi:MAG: hypothetical protein N2109_07090 [Fimbriimonadales bacterium]|nr:hypothetical protein [Fimbriimonadales bacterium]
MPYQIVRAKGGWLVQNAETHQVKGRHETYEKAKAQLRALYAAEKSRTRKED